MARASSGETRDAHSGNRCRRHRRGEIRTRYSLGLNVARSTATAACNSSTVTTAGTADTAELARRGQRRHLNHGRLELLIGLAWLTHDQHKVVVTATAG